MSRSTIYAHIDRRETGVATAAWAGYVLHTAFQPIYTLHGGKPVIEAYEGLLRPFRDGEAIPPIQFFRNVPAQDRLGVETLTRTLHLLNAGRFLDRSSLIFVNFDPSIFSDRKIIEDSLRDMRLVLHEADIDPSRIVCEVTEKKAISQSTLASFVTALREHGFMIAVDDYGAEESDMARVSALKPDIVKFDAQWTARLMDTSPGVALLSLMVQEFAANGMKTVFEGIEETWQLEIAENSGAHMVQGFALSRPELAPSSFAIATPEESGTPPGQVAPDKGVTRVSARRLSPKLFGKRPLS